MRSKGLRTFLRRLADDRHGAALPILAAFTIPAIGAIGTGIDTARIYMVRSQMQAGVDAAALAGARAFAVTDKSAKDRTKQVEAYFYGNFPQGYMHSQSLVLTPTFSTKNNIHVTTVEAEADLPMTFMRVLGFDKQRIRTVARAELQPRPLEVMVVLDNTGSMKANLPRDANGVVKTRMTATKDAAKSFVDILYQGAGTRQELALGFVMYDITVNVGHLLTKWRSSSVRQLAGFNDSATQARGPWPGNRLAWKGCVLADDTVRNMNATYSQPEPGAWDVVRSLPGEGGHPPITPYFIPPFWVPQTSGNSASSAVMANPNSGFYKISNVEPGYNLYQLDQTLANGGLNQASMASSPYREAFYRYYIGLNDSASSVSNDVITRVDGSFYNPQTDSWNFATSRGTPFRINYDRIPNFAAWKAATTYSVNPKGGSTSSGSQNMTDPPSPNWQCPEEAEPIAYGKPKSYWIDNVIERKNGAIYPANGTLHHAGLLWGYRLLVRDDVFQRSNPTSEEAKRALVFMTDGETALGESQNGYTDRTFTFYGNYADNPLTTTQNGGAFRTQSERRFSKTCASLQAEKNPPKVYIIALTTTDTNTLAMFERCAPGRVYRTSDTASLKSAFDDVATELVDLHLTK
ncbi:TadE/TadG family type IV pilus assembly protein [Sphingomonas sp.]|uniref:TadE/TadG family type IV pilus assembly protein n=1 Tax=Sphingomonas sp. TaxID=28214 RepID=UPI00262F3728|nr:pilus assembly protein TadG-related protein [Sphingomonas sp.]MDF2603706.1 Flp pilus assembly protein TadG [Sphingomonas sp.]